MIKNDLVLAQRYIDNAIKILDETPEKEHISRLINVCKALDEYYKEWCSENDNQFGLQEGETYEDGANCEFYIEASDWHEISKALRNL